MKLTLVALVCMLVNAPSHPGAQNLQPSGALKSPEPQGRRAIPQTAANTLTFDHFNLQPAQADPMVLRLADGEYFQVRIINTDNTLFTYSISAVPDEETPQTMLGPTGAGVVVTRFVETAVTMRHSEAFARYRVRISLRTDLAPAAPPSVPRDQVGASPTAKTPSEKAKELVLYPSVFDVWVETKPGFEVTFTGGAVFSGLRSPRYHIKTDTLGTNDTADDLRTVEEDPDAKDDFWPDTVAVANFRHPEKLRGLGLAAGVGLNNNADPRFFLGPSYFFGRNLLLTAGWLGGTVDRLPTGQQVGQAPINGDNTLTTLPKRFKNTFYVGFAFSFIPKAEENFKGAFGATQKTGAPPAEETETEEPEGTAGVSAAAASGEYSSTEGQKAAVTAVGDDSVAVTLPGETPITMKGDGSVYTGASGGVDTSCSFELSTDKKTMTMTCLRDTKPLFKGTKPGTK